MNNLTYTFSKMGGIKSKEQEVEYAAIYAVTPVAAAVTVKVFFKHKGMKGLMYMAIILFILNFGTSAFLIGPMLRKKNKVCSSESYTDAVRSSLLSSLIPAITGSIGIVGIYFMASGAVALVKEVEKVKTIYYVEAIIIAALLGGFGGIMANINIDKKNTC